MTFPPNIPAVTPVSVITGFLGAGKTTLLNFLVKDPTNTGFSAMIWDLDQNSSLALCGFFRKQNVYCDVMTPEGFAGIAAKAAQTEKAQPTAQGADSAPQAKKKRKTKK